MVFLPSKGIDFMSCPAHRVRDMLYPSLDSVFRDFSSSCAIVFFTARFSVLMTSNRVEFQMLSNPGLLVFSAAQSFNNTINHIIHICMSLYALYPAGSRPAERFFD
ncbi:MAG: hypothetical protein ABFD91_14980 [Anaerohalosphaeraceae bacterium]